MFYVHPAWAPTVLKVLYLEINNINSIKSYLSGKRRKCGNVTSVLLDQFHFSTWPSPPHLLGERLPDPYELASHRWNLIVFFLRA